MEKQSCFDQWIERRETGSYKWGRKEHGTEEGKRIPMWVADMDFACPEAIVKAVKERASHPLYGYTQRGEGYVEIIAGWMERRYGYRPKEEWVSFAPPGVLYAVYTMLRLITEPGDGVAVLMPNYDPLHEVVTKSGRKLLTSQLKVKARGDGEEGGAEIDFADLEKKLSGAKALLLSNPHNPTGRVWREEELRKIADLCGRYGTYVISDEIHADFVSKERGHTAFVSIGEEAAKNCMACYSANKGFNLGGLQTATLLIADGEKRKAFEREMELGQTRLDNIFGIVATRTAYGDPSCETWLDQAIEYVEENKRLMYQRLEERIPEIRPVPSEGTYLAWLDCGGLGLSGKELEDFFLTEAGVELCMGEEFDPTAQQWARINLACPRELMEQALERIEKAAKKRRKER